MPRTIVIDPVTRVEGHARISIYLDGEGAVRDSRLHVTQLRGFEVFCQGRPLEEMPGLTARTCGICPVSHLLASAKACDQLLAVQIPPAAQLLRRLLNFAQLVQSHALSFFYLSSPDLLLGLDADPAQRNIFGVAAAHPETARDGVALRRYGQQIIERLAGKRIHPDWVVPGGVSRPLNPESRAELQAELPAMLERAWRSLELTLDLLPRFQAEIAAYAEPATHFLALAGPNGTPEYYDGPLRLLAADGSSLADDLAPERYPEIIAEAVEADSYLKSPYYLPLGPEAGCYRVGPLARLNLAARCGTPRADEALERFRQATPSPGLRQSAFHYHLARLIEIIHGLEMIGELLANPAIYESRESRVRAVAGANAPEGVGICEAPRGTLIHHYRIDDQGRISGVNMIIATGHNNLAINRSLGQVARTFIKGGEVKEGMLNRVEALLRCYDPCLSCSTHAVGIPAFTVELIASDGRRRRL